VDRRTGRSPRPHRKVTDTPFDWGRGLGSNPDPFLVAGGSRFLLAKCWQQCAPMSVGEDYSALGLKADADQKHPMIPVAPKADTCLGPKQATGRSDRNSTALFSADPQEVPGLRSVTKNIDRIVGSASGTLMVKSKLTSTKAYFVTRLSIWVAGSAHIRFN
jgi:hypothetical protein